MRHLQLKSLALGAALIVAAAAPAAANDGAADGMPARTTWTYDGPVLVTPSGMTLYMNSAENTKAEKFRWQCTDRLPDRTNDQQSGVGERPTMGYKFLKSCIQQYPAYIADANAKPVGRFTIVERPGGAKQWAYLGYPLYLSLKDHKAGERYGAAPGLFGAGGGAAGRGGFRIATEAIDLPPGLKFSRHEEGLILASTDPDRPLYTPRAGKRVMLAGTGAELFRPLAAPAIASVNGEWAIIDAGAGMKQYAFRGKLLYVAPAGYSEREIAEAGGWDLVVVQKAPSRPAAIGKQLALMGEVYTDKKGMTLYTYNCSPGGGPGGGGGSSCNDVGGPAVFMVALCGDSKECARRWHPYIAPANAKAEGEFSIVDITYPMFTDPRGMLYPSDAPKAKVWAYRGRPLFTYYQDEEPGDIWGDNTKGLWGSNFGVVQVPGRSSFELP